FLERNHEVTEEEEVKQSKVAWTEPQSNPGSKLDHVWTRLAQAPKRDPIKDVPRLPTLILGHVWAWQGQVPNVTHTMPKRSSQAQVQSKQVTFGPETSPSQT
ncbi:hypothetical protein PIB30_106059, partial [Stylosanthes scabra]|nr:hypothetical protein [Stylosanthes scabra]